MFMQQQQTVGIHENHLRIGNRREGIITYDGGRFYPKDNQNYSMDPVRLFVAEVRREENSNNFMQCEEAVSRVPAKSTTQRQRQSNNNNNNSTRVVATTDPSDDDETQSPPVQLDPAIQREFNRNMYMSALKGSRALSFIYNGGTQPGVRRTVKPASGSESNTEKFRAYDPNGVLKTYYYSKVDQMKIVAS